MGELSQRGCLGAISVMLTVGIGLACSSSDFVGRQSDSSIGREAGTTADGSTGVVVQVPDGGSAADTGGLGIPQNIERMRIDPANSIVTVERGKKATLRYRAFATMRGDPTEVEITSRTVFYVPDNYLAAAFPTDGSPTLSTRLPTSDTDPAQRGGPLTVQAQAANSNDPPTTVTTTLTVKVVDVAQAAAGSGAATPAIPADAAAMFAGAEDPKLAPTLVYPNDGVLLPPNLGSLEIHFLPGQKSDALYEVALSSSYSDLRVYTRCNADSTRFLDGSCILELGPSVVNVVAQSNRGTAPVQLTVRGSDESGSVGSAKKIAVQFAGDRVDGAVYYWTASSSPRIMRFDFGSQSGLAPFLKPSDLPDDNGNPSSGTRCVGCHSLSRDGQRLMAVSGDSAASYLVYINDLTAPRTSSSWLTVDGRAFGAASQNRAISTSFNPDGSEFVAVPPVEDWSVPATSLVFHDGLTGLRKTSTDGTLALGFTPAFPDWSPDGGSIAVTRIYGGNQTTIEFQEGGISLVRRTSSGWSLPAIEIVPHAAGKNRYNATFVPDSSLLLYSESARQGSDTDSVVDAYSDPSATTWAVAPIAGAQPVLLKRANAPGVADGLALGDDWDQALQKRLVAGQLMNTFARAAPFSGKQDGHKLFWFTVSSQRRAGLRRYYPNPSVVGDPSTQTLLWMFALDVDKALAGQDGSYPGFFLPFQDMTTSNHMATWAQKYVSDEPLRATAPPPPPSAPPAPPPMLY